MSVREDYERRTGELVGRRIEAVTYWDVLLGRSPRAWDHGAWHRAVMGVDLVTDAGPVCIQWTSTFYPYGVEVFLSPLAEHLDTGELEPVRWDATTHEQWRRRADDAVQAVDIFWERFEPGASVGPERPRVIEVPVALRLDFAVGPVWFVAGVPQETGPVYLGDEIAVAFSAETMLQFGFPPGTFVEP